MVRAAPPQGSGGGGGGGGGTAVPEDSIEIAGTNKFHWNLRSFHEHEESFRERDEHFKNHGVQKTASSIFGGGINSSSSHHHGISETSTIPVRTAKVDGCQVCFELRQDVSQPPTVDRETRLRRTIINRNVQPSSWEVRLRFWMIRFSLIQVTVAYLILFMVLNVVFAALFYAHPDGCCGDDEEHDFHDIMAFTVQTSTTIGYGGYVPSGYYANFLVVMLSYVSVLLNSILAGLFFLKFITPVAKIEFSNVMVYCNANGLPCLQLRVGNADGLNNKLTDIRARMTHTYLVKYKDAKGKEHQLGQSQELKLLNDQREGLSSVWTLRHVIDETSPLFGLNLSEYPGNTIIEFRVTISAVQDMTKSPIVADSAYMIEDVMIGHNFQDQMTFDLTTRTGIIDYAKMSSTEPAQVWYPAERSKL